MPGYGWERALDNSQGKGVWHFSFNVVPDIPEALTAGRERALLEHFWTDIAYDPAAISEADKQLYTAAYSRPEAMRAGFNWYRTVFEDARAIRDGGGNGSIIGRNTFQRPRDEAIAMLDRLFRIYKGEE